MPTYSTGCVRDYVPNGCLGPDLPATIPEGANFRFWYDFAGGFQLVSRWENGDVWGSDFRDAQGGDLSSSGGSDIPESRSLLVCRPWQLSKPARTYQPRLYHRMWQLR